MATATPKVAILGAGIAGATVAVALKTARANAELIVVDRNFESQSPGALLDILYGLKKPDSVTFSTLQAFQKLGVQIIRGEVLRVDGDKRSIYTAVRTFTPDYIIIALGMEPHLSPFDGANTLPVLASLKDAATLAERLLSSGAGDYLIISPATDTCLHLLPIEAALAVHHLLVRAGKRKNARIRIISPEPLPFSRWDPNFSNAISAYLAKHEIEWLGNMQPASVKGNILTTRLGAEIPFQFAFLIPPVQVPRLFQHSTMLDASGWVQANSYLFNSRGDRVYAIGACAGFILPSSPKDQPPLLFPKWPQNAYDQAVILADNLVKEWKRDIKLVRYSGSAESSMRVGPSSFASISGDFLSQQPPAISLKFPGLLPFGSRASPIPDLRKILS
jgi:NADH dehydrogenase FAD-containing subunit